MYGAVEGLSVKADVTLVDGVDIGLPINAEYIVKGDLKSYTIGCASILAKVYRDEMMIRYAQDYPEYGFEKHKGYGTKAHMEALRQHGPSPIHRKQFIRFLEKK